MIVKLQRPLYSSGPGPGETLIYNKSRRYQVMVEMSEETLDRLLGDDPKGYFEADIKNGVLAIGERVADQPW